MNQLHLPYPKLWIVLALCIGLTACDEDTLGDLLGDENHQENFFSMFDEMDEVELDCVEFVFPITIAQPDGSTTVVNDEEELEQAIINAMGNETYPDIVFPIQILDEDDQPQTIATDEELCELFMECFEEWEDDEDDDCDCHDDEEECFEIHYPITLVFPDGSQTVVNDDEALETAVDNYYDANPNDDDDVTVVYPITVTLLENDSTVVINDEDELDEILELCFDYDFEECFELQFPISFAMPDGSTLTANTEEELDSLYEAWEMANPNATDEPTLIFPITVTMLEDGSSEIINDEDELEELIEDCYDDICGMVDGMDIIIGKSSAVINRMAAKKQYLRKN